VVHHDGTGTTGAGLRAGRPSLIVPFIGAQTFWGRQVYAGGLGPPPLDKDRLSIDALTEAITTMLTDQAMRDRAAAMGEQIRAEDGPENVVHLVEEHVRPS
jgi:sterol 3beta-glucosyltransferase